MSRQIALVLAACAWAPVHVCALQTAARAEGLPTPTALGAAAPLSPEDRSYGPGVDQLAARATLARELGARVDVRWDPATGAPRALRIVPGLPVDARDPETAARDGLRRLAALYGMHQAPELTLLEQRAAPTGATVRFAQRLGDAWVEDAELLVRLRRDGEAVRLVSVHGRLYRDLPRALPPIPAVAAEPIRLGGLTLVGTEPKLLATLRPDGAWKHARRVIELGDHALVAVIEDGRGRVLHREPLSLGGHAAGKVFPRNPRDTGAKTVAIGSLRLHDAEAGTRFLADAFGNFGGQRAALPWGFWGPRDRVLATAPSYPSTQDGTLELTFADDDPRLDELNVYHHLVEARAAFGAYADIPEVAAALEKTIVATVNTHHTNALAVPTAAELHGETYDHPLFFGTLHSAASRDASVVIHERTHALLFDLGLKGGGDGSSIHEGLADYFACVFLGTPEVGAYSMGPYARNVSELRIYPEHDGEAHYAGVIVSGTLWDLRREVGEVADRLALLAVIGLGSKPSLLDYRDALLAAEAEAYGGKHEAALRRHLTRHGLLSAHEGVERPPVITLRYDDAAPAKADDADAADDAARGEPVGQTLRLKREGEHRVLRLAATDPEGRPVTLGVEGAELLAGATARRETAAGPQVELTLRPTLPPGRYPLAVTAQDAEGQVAVRTFLVFVLSDAEEGERLVKAVVRAEPGVAKRVPLSSLVFQDGRALSPSFSARLAGARVADARIEGRELVLEPRAHEAGLHNLMLLVRQDRLRGERIVDVAVAVGGGPYIDVLTRVPATSLEGAQRARVLARVTPDQVVTVPAGEALQLAAQAWAVLPGEPAPEQPVTLELASASPGLNVVSAPIYRKIMPTTVNPLLFLQNVFAALFESVERADQHLALYVTPDREHAVAEGTLELIARRGDAVARRTVRVVVLPPGADAPPVIELPPQVALRDGEAQFEVSARDPEGGDVTLELLYPLDEGTPRGSFDADEPSGFGRGLANLVGLDGAGRRAKGAGTVHLRGDQPFMAVVLATDAQGNTTARAVEVLVDGQAPAQPQAPRGAGIEDRLRGLWSQAVGGAQR